MAEHLDNLDVQYFHLVQYTFISVLFKFSTIWNNENDPVGIFAEYCSHGRSHQFFAESIVHPNGFIAVQCATWIDFQLGKCNNSNTAVMGEFISSDERGIFYLETNAQPPFGKNEIR